MSYNITTGAEHGRYIAEFWDDSHLPGQLLNKATGVSAPDAVAKLARHYPGDRGFATALREWKQTHKRVDVLCQCGWGRLGIALTDVPNFCPLCGAGIASAE